MKLPAVRDGNDTGLILSNGKKHRHGEIKVFTRRITPTAIVASLSEVRRAEISGGDKD